MEAIKELLFKMADDALIFGHRNSEWTGIGPTLEEDIAFSSMAQDKIGHAWVLYKILHEKFDCESPDLLAFNRQEKEYKCCHLVEFYTKDYAFALMRQFFYDHAEYIRYEFLSSSSFEPLAELARKIKGEIKYHILHADTWVKSLSRGTEESKARMQAALNEVYPLALGIFEKGKFEAELISQNIFAGEKALQDAWEKVVSKLISEAGLLIPVVTNETIGFGGRQGYHTNQLKPLLTEMKEVFNTEPGATW